LRVIQLLIMTELSTPDCNFDEKAHDFSLKGVDGKTWTLQDCAGPKGLLLMFICNHCPYVKVILDKLVVETDVLAMKGIGCVAINPNDFISFPDDSYENMKIVSKKNGFGFPYLIDTNQEAAKEYNSVCTPDFFGYNSNLELQYRGRFDDRGSKNISNPNQSDLFKAMFQNARTGKGPLKQESSIGCSIKWRK
jgi:peroxiredoxin